MVQTAAVFKTAKTALQTLTAKGQKHDERVETKGEATKNIQHPDEEPRASFQRRCRPFQTGREDALPLNGSGPVAGRLG